MRRRSQPWLKPAFFVGSLAPLAYLALLAGMGRLTANPIAFVENQLGLVALIFLVSALACRPARAIFGWAWPMRLRRQLGLFAFFYAALHFATYVVLDQFFDWKAIVDDVVERNFILAGFLALVLLTPLAFTSTSGWVRRLGFVRWQRLHSLIYPAGALAVLHFVWRVKKDERQPLAYALVLGAFLLVRVVIVLRQRRRRTSIPARGGSQQPAL